MAELSIVLADGDQHVRTHLRDLIESQSNIVVLGECDTTESTLFKVEATHPQILLLDISLPVQSSLGVLELIRLASDVSRVIVMSLHKDEIYVRETFQAGAMGFILKTDPAHKLLRSIHLTAQCDRRKFSPWPPPVSAFERRVNH